MALPGYFAQHVEYSPERPLGYTTWLQPVDERGAPTSDR